MKKLVLSVIAVASLALLPAMQAGDNTPPPCCTGKACCCQKATGKAHSKNCACPACAKAKKAGNKAESKAGKKAENKAAKKAAKEAEK